MKFYPLEKLEFHDGNSLVAEYLPGFSYRFDPDLEEADFHEFAPPESRRARKLKALVDQWQKEGKITFSEDEARSVVNGVASVEK